MGRIQGALGNTHTLTLHHTSHQAREIMDRFIMNNCSTRISVGFGQNIGKKWKTTHMNGQARHRSGMMTLRAALSTYTPKMNKLGESDLVVPEICLGTMTWGQQNTEAEAHEQLSYALDCGVNFMDAAEMYPVPTNADTQGLTEKYIGTWLKKQKRDDLIIASKVAGRSDRITWLRDGEPCKVTKEDIQTAVDGILTRLDTDYIDLLQIHWPDRYVPLFGSAAYDEANEIDAVSF